MDLVFEVLVDHQEKPHKCTILPLSDHPGFRIRRFHRGKPIEPMTGQIMLHPDGEDLSKAPFGGRNHGEPKVPQEGRALLDSGERALGVEPWVLSVIDCNWRRLPGIIQKIGQPLPRPVRIPEGFVTAYPRRNRQNLDPKDGLATIEAIFIAAAFMGRYDEGLLERYHWKRDFLELNKKKFQDYELI